MLDIISAICSIAGFIISLVTVIYAFFIERKISAFEKKILFNTRITTLANNLKKHSSQLSKDLGNKDERKIRETLSLCKTVIEDISAKLPYDLNKQCIKTRDLLKKQYCSNFQLEKKEIPFWKFWETAITLDSLWGSYDNLNSLITRIDNLKKDKKIIS